LEGSRVIDVEKTDREADEETAEPNPEGEA